MYYRATSYPLQVRHRQWQSMRRQYKDFACIFLALIKTFCDFVVELIHGKPAIQHINLPDGTKIEQKIKSPKTTNDVSGSVSMSPADVSVRSN